MHNRQWRPLSRDAQAYLWMRLKSSRQLRDQWSHLGVGRYHMRRHAHCGEGGGTGGTNGRHQAMGSERLSEGLCQTQGGGYLPEVPDLYLTGKGNGVQTTGNKVLYQLL